MRNIVGRFDIEGTVVSITPWQSRPITVSEVNENTSFSTGMAIGWFEGMLSDLKEPIGEIIPGFHNMELRSRQLSQAVADDAAKRMSDPEVRQILSFIGQYDHEMCKAERMFRDGILPKRICHCDAKVNNILFDGNGDVQCVIDLDTVMPSSWSGRGIRLHFLSMLLKKLNSSLLLIFVESK